MPKIDDIHELVHGAGERMTGSSMTNEEAMAFFQEQRGRGEYCLVRDWIWIDLDLTKAESRILEQSRRQPALLYAHTVIFDSDRRWDVGDFVRTSPLLAFEQGFLFRTFNTTYILLGDGLRKRATLKTVGLIF
tara:strand:- start:2347 stop:2745 length:399 start_codon:yes stop_codon:yes gene_type:complete